MDEETQHHLRGFKMTSKLCKTCGIKELHHDPKNLLYDRTCEKFQPEDVVSLSDQMTQWNEMSKQKKETQKA